MIDPELAIGNPADLGETLHAIVLSAQQKFSADVCLIVAVNPINQWVIEPPTVMSKAQELNTLADRQFRLDKLVRQTLDQGLTLLDGSTKKGKAMIEQLGLPESSSLAAVGLFTPRRHRPLAVLLIGYRDRHRFDSTAQEDLKSFAAHAALTLKDTWLLRRYREVTRIGQEINQGLDSYEILFEKLRTQLAGIIDTSHFLLLAVHQPRTPTHRAHSAEARFVDLYMSERGKVKFQRVEPDYPIFRDTSPKLIRHYNEEVSKSVPNLKQIEGTEHAIPQSRIFVPLIFRDDSFGLLSIQHINPNVYDDEDLQLLELIGNQVAQALSNLRLFKYLDELNETGQKLTQQLDSERLFQEVVDQIRETTEADVVVLYPYDEKRPDGDRFVTPPNTSGELLKKSFPNPDHINLDDIAWLALKKGGPVFVKDTAKLYETLGGAPNKRKGNFEEREQIKSTAALTLKIGDEAVGVLFVNYRIAQRFDAPQKTLIQGLASYAAIAIRNSGLLNRSLRLAHLREIDRAISKTLDLNQVLETILTEATSVVQADEAAILLYNERKKALEIKAATGRKTAERLNRNIPLERGIGITKWVYENKKAARVGNVLHDPQWKDIYNQFSEDTISEIDVPLLDGDDVIGVINFESNKENAYSQRDEDFITNLAAQAVVAVKNAQLYEKEQRAVTEQLAMQEIEREIVSHLNLPKVLEKILDKALEITRSTAGQVLLYDLRRNDLYIAAEQGVPLEFKEYRQAAGEGIVWEAIRQGKALRVDITDPFWEKKYIRLIQNANWELAVPILDGNEIRGAINIESETENPLTERDERLLTQLADLALIALQNAEQYEKVEKRERQLEALHNVDIRIIEQQDDLEQSIKAIVKAAGELISAEIAGLHLYQKELPPITYLSRQGECQNDEGLSQWTAFSRESDAGTSDRSRIVAQVRQTGKPYITKGDAQDDPLYLGDPEIHSEIAVPLKLNDKVVGVLNLESQRDYAFDQDHVEVLELLAEQAVIAIQNALNFIKAREESKRFELLVNIGRALGEITAPEQKQRAFEICFGEAMKQYSEGQVIYRRYDKEREEFALEFALEKFEMVTHITPKNIKRADGLNGQVARERRAILVKDVDNLEEGVAPPTTHPDIKTLIVAPVIFEDHYYGNVTLRHTRAGYYQEPDCLLLWGMATQLAITLRRLEAVEAQQEAEQQARSMEVFTQLGQSAYEITHRLGNELGLVATCVNQIRDVLEENKIASTVIYEELNKIVKDVGQVLSMCIGVKEKVAGLRDEGKSTPLPVILPVKALLEEAKWSSSPANIEMSWVVADDLGSVKIVTGQIIDILYTLITNAIEAMPEGGRITVRAYKSGSDVHVEVADNGPGISPANQSKIFNLFFSTKRSSGFGLWSAQRYARANVGDLTVSSELGKGATFTLKLPLASSPENGHS